MAEKTVTWVTWLGKLLPKLLQWLLPVAAAAVEAAATVEQLGAAWWTTVRAEMGGGKISSWPGVG